MQFIGRFARVGDASIGGARFYAVPAEIEGETAKLLDDGAVWGDLVNLAEARVTAESEARARIAAIEPASLTDEALEDLSLHSLRPSQHVKVYQVPADAELDITAEADLPKPFETVYRRTDANESMAIFIGREQQKPPWGDQIQLGRSEYELVIVYYDRNANLLFINSSRRADSLYRQIGQQYLGRPPKILPLYKINRCLAGLTNIECFSVGMKNRLHTSHAESYRIIAGRNAHSAIRRTDGRLFHRGHIFCRAQENGSPVTLGYSSGSKLWSTNKGKITSLLDWCRALAQKINNATGAVAAPGLDILSVGEPLQVLPPNLLAADWDSVVYEDLIAFSPPNGGLAVPLTDTSIVVDRAGSTATSLRLAVEHNDQRWCFDFTPASQVLAGFDDQRVRAVLAGVRVGLTIGTDAVSPEGRALVDLLVRLLARLYPTLVICSGARDIVNEAESLARRINPNIDFATDPTVAIAVGTALPAVRIERPIFVGSDAWNAFITTSGPCAVGKSTNPFGAGVAACLAAANLFRWVFQGEEARLDNDATFPALESESHTGGDQVLAGSLGESVLVGAGAIGNGAAWALSRVPMEGVLHVVDHEAIELSNIQRYALVDRADECAMKADVLIAAGRSRGKVSEICRKARG